MSKVYLFVEIDVKSGQKSAFLEKLAAHGAHIRTEEGCEALEIFHDVNDENKVCVWEIWTSRAQWDAHMVNDASKAWQQVAPAFVNGEKITVMDAIQFRNAFQPLHKLDQQSYLCKYHQMK